MGGTTTKRAENLRYRVDRGPNWLFIKLLPGQTEAQTRQWVDELWDVCNRHFTYRLVLELEDLDDVSTAVTRRLEKLRERLVAHDGALRLCGANINCAKSLSGSHYAMNLKNHPNRAVAVLGAKEKSSVR
jgi:hypothetical protein